MINKFNAIDQLSWSDFEIFVKDVFVAAGWTNAIITEQGKEYKHGDGGVDIFAYKYNRKFAIEVKQRNYGINVDVKALNQLVTGAKLANVSNMILVTNSYFTSEVKIRALRLGVELIDRDRLQDLWIKKHSEIGCNIKPRKHQESVIQHSLNHFKAGKSRLLIEMATGLGKTYTVALLVKNIIRESDTELRILFLAHQVEILLQSVTAFKNVFGIGTYSFSACFGGADPEYTDFVFGSFDTLFTKLDKLKKDVFDIVIVDEAHHTAAPTYAVVVKHFAPKLLVGLTATPYRMDNKDVLAFFGGNEGHVGRYDLVWALRNDKLAFPKYLVLLDDLDQSRIEQLKKGLSINDLDKRLFLHKKDVEVIRIIESTIQEKKIENPKGIVFCQNISHIKHLIQFFPVGSATFVHSKMSDQQRQQNIRDFREHNYHYILVCNLFNEGIDIPETNILIFLRDTASYTIWLQQLGRGLRKTPNKDYVHVLDFIGSLERLNEVQQLFQQVKDTKLDKNNFEPLPKKESFHDSTFEVNYNKSAAQVLKLLGELKYRLKSRYQAIDILRSYWEKHEDIPQLQELEKELDGISYDQISTLFDSYYGYIEVALSGQYDVISFRDKFLDWAKSFYRQNSIPPTIKAIGLSNQYNRLLVCTEDEIRIIIGNEKQLEEYLEAQQPKLESVVNLEAQRPKLEPIVNDDIDNTSESNLNNEKLEEKIILKYLHTVKTPTQLCQLSEAERSQIRKIFHSEFRFLKLLQERRCNG
ncbi:DEAD/DEAH box helicase family protein [Candidatus Parabeggiatoa sp. HSG14]|uniref:DEAD/DEAH box helicase family protein n=1 Tax=Candidatus Parabeggiatoa sp. HSG14 TaxID=3055593 RepID=UPI0025A7C36B|nr:DEAD/DEAH box helicase family protein [Thiotrichales bacterium HSG14]